METIELKLSLSKEQFDMICCGLKALADSMAAIMADNVADTQPSSNTYIYTNMGEDTNTYKDYKTRVESLITNLATNTKLTTDTTKSTLNTTLTTSSNKNNNNNIINNMSSKEIDNMSGKEISNTNIENSNTCKEDPLPRVNMDYEFYVEDGQQKVREIPIPEGVPTLQEVKNYVMVSGYKMNPQKFYDYYKTKGWKTMGGTSIIGRWKEYVDKWAQNEYKPTGQAQAAPVYTGGKAGMGTVRLFQRGSRRQ